MKQSFRVISVCIIAAFLAACGLGDNGLSSSTTGAPYTAGRSGAAGGAASHSEQVLYSFTGGDGAYPSAALRNVNGVLYGTTLQGGGLGACFGTLGCGTVFTLVPSGAETVVRRFGNEYSYPESALLNVNGTLYGTTAGLRTKPGTVFAITASGKLRLLHHFGQTPGDGKKPFAGLIDVNGTLYGTTGAGGASDDGTVFSITTSGVETVLHSFDGGLGDGVDPDAALINVHGTLYGTTYAGGKGCRASGGCGTVFSITTSGKETVLHRFGGGSKDGANPRAALVNVRGTLYGSTESGGSSSSCVAYGPTGCGTIFSITTSGKETVLYRFKGGTDGAAPDAELVNVHGTLYGTTYSGGGVSIGCTAIGTAGCGTVFSITTSGEETVLHSFEGFTAGDGQFPRAGLLSMTGMLFGTTDQGGANGWGTVFSLSP